MQILRINDKEYAIEQMPSICLDLINKLSSTKAEILNLMNMHAVLTRAKNAYIEDLKKEIVESKSGISFESLFSDDDFEVK